MSWTALLEFLLGLAITIAALTDVFTSVLVPSPASGWLRITGHVRTIALQAWRARRRLPGGRNGRLSNLFGPLLFFFAFLTWVLLLFLGFGIMFHAAGDLFNPPLGTLSDAIYLAGSSFVTLGVSEVDAIGFGRWLVLCAGLSGFSIITATVTFILQVQAAFDQREWRVLTLRDTAGQPPSGIGLLENFGKLGMQAELPDFFNGWRDWSATVLHSHAAHPILGYFHSVDHESDWLSALATVLDAATLVAALTESPAKGPATLLQRSGARTAASLCALYDLDRDAPDRASTATIEQLGARLAAAGYELSDPQGARERFEQMRATYSAEIAAIATHLGTPRVPLLTAENCPE
jgi:hypothetical protein